MNDLTAIRAKIDLCLYCNGSGAEGHPDNSTGCEFCYASGGTLDARSAVALCDEVERLRAENERLRTALTKINVGDGWAAQIARAALAQKGGE